MFAQFESFVYNVIWGYPILIAVGGFGLYVTIRSGFFQFRMLPTILKYPFQKEATDSEAAGQNLSTLEAVSIAIGGAVGVSNISGVGTAIATGGPGALFWMLVAAFLGMMTKLVETS
ncbi:MAG: sodium:alanine symporter family protein, partial [Firmicutes bacterium]|nr:sodium:alanine symporter family protein [Bacillota bacterium]